MSAAVRLREEAARFAAEVSFGKPGISGLGEEEDDDFWDDTGAAERLGLAASRMLSASTSGQEGVTPVGETQPASRDGAHSRSAEEVQSAARVDGGTVGLKERHAAHEALLKAMKSIIEDCDALYRKTALSGATVRCTVAKTPLSLALDMRGKQCRFVFFSLSSERTSHICCYIPQMESQTPCLWRLSRRNYARLSGLQR